MKSILVIDTPKNCPNCQLMADGWCYGVPSREEVQGKIKYLKRPSWCPLRPLPQKLKLRIQREWITDYDRYEIGYNACIEKILGETE